MEPIINPWWIYAIGICSNISFIFVLASSLLTAAFMFIGFFFISDFECGYPEKKDKKTELDLLKKIAIALCITLIPCIVVPNEKTCYKMIATQVITVDNINANEDHIVNLIERIVDAIESRKDNKK